ncbi:type II toxin-antitoxin system Phd/YefM family antitoxin [Gemmatimonas sp.]|jgi:antitoxin YefM|uniref:type II toxin-antitoxin system Phd/YefM family antitoxin n=1 Tax=Gemmatimonas sp. TaxID=1962908 RepID=UPI003DA4D612
MTTTTYSHLREHLAEVWDEVESSQEPVILQRRGHEDLALIPAAELKSLQETAHLLRSPKNAARLLAALTRAEARANDPTSLEALRAMLEVASAD